MLLSRPQAAVGHALKLRHCRFRVGSQDEALVRTGWSSPPATAAQWPSARLAGGRRGQVRGKKTRTVVRLEDLPQGVIRPADPAPPREADEPAPAYPTVILQARRNMDKFDNCVLLTRVGGFYEMYFEHAQECGPLLNLKVASKKTNAGPVPMVSGSPKSRERSADARGRPASPSSSWIAFSRSWCRTCTAMSPLPRSSLTTHPRRFGLAA